MQLYSGHCPNQQSKGFKLNWRDHTSYDIAIFRIQNMTNLVFSCDVVLYAEIEDRADACKQTARHGNVGGDKLQTGNVQRNDLFYIYL